MNDKVIANLGPYPAYKPSGAGWLGEVPENWDIRRLKYLLRECHSFSLDGSEQLLRVSQYTGVTERRHADDEEEPDSRAESLAGYKHVEPSDLVVNIMLAWNGSLGVSQFQGITSPAYCVYRFGEHAFPWYFHYVLRTPTYKGRIKAISTGVVESRLRLYTDELYRIEVPLPPLDEQVAIVRYLDEADEKIQAYISAKERLIGLLEEQRQAIIHRAVTRGLDPNVKLKPSGVEWLGDVPKHWQIRRLRSLATIETGGQDTINRKDDGDYPFFVRSQTVEKIDSWVYDGEAVLTAGDGVGVGKVFHYINGKFNYHQRVYKFSDFSGISGRFFFQSFKTHLSQLVLRGTAKSTVDSLRLPMLQNFPVPLPPTDEQETIVNFCDKRTADIDRAIHLAEHQTELMEEYRTRLIADVVTGKLDVRNAVLTKADSSPPVTQL